MVSKQERKARAQGLRQLGRIFLEVGTAATQGPATRVREQPAASTIASMTCCTSLLASALGHFFCSGICELSRQAALWLGFDDSAALGLAAGLQAVFAASLF